jgi:chromate transporter
MQPPPALPSFAEAVRLWAKIGLLSFGGPAGQIAMLHREVVEERHWLGEARFLRALSFCALLPGPEAQQLATYLGWLMHGPWGGIAAGTLFVLPGAAVLLVLSILFVTLGNIPMVAGVFLGLKCAVLALVVQAMLRIGRRALKTQAAWAVALASLTGLILFRLPFPIIILASGLAGAIQPKAFQNSAPPPPETGLLDRHFPHQQGIPPAKRHAAWRASALCAALWLAPVALLQAAGPPRFAAIAWFFSKMAVVTVGGAYAVLAYVAQDAVDLHHWLSPTEMLTGLGLAESTPGPLVLVLQFVGFLAGYRAPGAGGIAGGVAASALTLWVTFMPCFTFVFLGAPIMERLAGSRALHGALSAVTASVVGVIANLAIWFGLHVLFTRWQGVHVGPMLLDLPLAGSLAVPSLALAAVGAVLLFGLRQPAPRTLALCAALGAAIELATGG